MVSSPTFGHVHSDFCERGVTLSARPRTLDLSSSDHNAPCTSRSGPQEPGQSAGHGEGNFAASGSTALEALTEVVREAFTRLFNHDESGRIFLDSGDGSDDDEYWEDNMDPLTFARYYVGPSNPHFVKMVQDHDLEMKDRVE